MRLKKNIHKKTGKRVPFIKKNEIQPKGMAFIKRNGFN